MLGSDFKVMSSNCGVEEMFVFFGYAWWPEPRTRWFLNALLLFQKPSFRQSGFILCRAFSVCRISVQRFQTKQPTLRLPCACFVEESYPTPHIHEQMTTSNYGYDTAYTFTQNNITLEHNAMNNMNNITHMDAHNTQY